MSCVRIFAKSEPQIGYLARTVTYGDEFKMVKAYIDYICKKADKHKSKETAIFIEPQMETGYPDLVIVEYYMSKHSIWNESRLKLNLRDLKILFQIQQKRVTTTTELNNLLGFSPEEIGKSLTILDSCGLTRYTNNGSQIRCVTQKAYFRIVKIIAIEAKIDKWTEAIKQATNNIWFSSESYILMNKNSCNSAIHEQCKDKGIGIILVNGKVEKILNSSVQKLPTSYASIQFNEWLLKSFFYEGANDDC